MSTSYSDDLWSCVMNDVVRRNPDSANKWRGVSNHESDCSQCADAGGGALVQCSTNHCNHEYHLHCAWNTQGSFVLENDTGNLKYECEAHHIPVTFCICKQEYDETLPMISCDDCNEWYHNKCVGLKGEPPETYTCQSCKNLKASGKKISEEKLLKNREKENRSADVQAANKAMSYLIYLHESVVPIMKNMYVPTLVKHKDITETLQILTTQFAAEDDSSILGGMSLNENESDDVERFGTGTVIQEWVQLLKICETKIQAWLKGSNDTMNRILKALNEPTLDIEQISLLEHQINELSVWHKQIDELPFIESSSGFVLILDCLKWLLVMMQLIHTEDDFSDQQYYNQINNHIKLSSSKIRKLEQSSYEYSSNFISIFNRYTSKANEMVSSMSLWSIEVEKKISGATSATLIDLESILNDAKNNFPRMPMSVDDLQEVIDSAKAVDSDINNIINDTNMGDLNTCLQLKNNANNITVVIPSLKKLNLVISFLYFLHDNDVNVNSKERAMEENVNELLQRSEFNCDDMNTSILSNSLIKSIEDAKKTLVSITSEVTEIKNDASKLLKEQTTVDEACENKINYLINKLRKYKVITTEERTLDYITTGKQLIGQAVFYIHCNDKNDITEVESCYKALTDMAEDVIADNYVLSKSIKVKIISKKEQLHSLLKSSQDLWRNVKTLISNCENGQTTYQEDFDASFNTAMSTANFVNKLILDTHDTFIENVKEQIPLCTEKLNAIVDPSKDLDAAKSLLNQVQHLPFPMMFCKAVLSRYDTCRLVCSCRDFTGATDLIELQQYQELRQQLFGLLNSQLSDTEKSMIETVKETFLFNLFKAEYAFSRHTKIAFDEVKTLRANASIIGDEAIKSPEFVQFNAEIDEFDNLYKNINELLHVLKVDIDKGNDSKQLSDSYKYEEVFNYWETNLLATQGKLREFLSSIMQKNFIDSNLEGQLASSMGLLDTILQAIRIHKEVDRSDRVVNIEAIPPIQLMQLTSVANKLKQQLESSENLVLERLSTLLNTYHSQAVKFNEYAIGLIPQRAKRKKQKTEQIPVSVLEDILKEPIAQVFVLPMRESLLTTLDCYYDLRKQILGLVSGNSIISKGVEDFNLIEAIKDNISRINDLMQVIEFQPIDIEYVVVLSWILDILSWMQSLSAICEDEESHAAGCLTFDFATAKIAAGLDLFVTIDSRVLEVLYELKVIKDAKENITSLDEMNFSKGLCIKSALSLLYQLQSYMADTKAFEAEFDEFQYKEIDNKTIRELYNKMTNLVIKPKDEIYKTIEAALNRINRSTTSSGRVIDSDKIRTIYDEDDDEDYGSDDYDQEDVKTSVKAERDTPALKKAKAEIDKKTAPALVKKEKPKKVTRKCCNPYCQNTTMQHSSYCSDTCAISTSQSIVSALLTMRTVLNESSSDSIHPDFKSLQESLTSKGETLDIREAISDINNGIINYQKLLFNDKRAAEKASDKKNISSILQCLPSAASFLLKTDYDTTDDKDKFRLDVRYRLEDILITSLIRQGVFGAVSIGAVLAVDLEEELHKKHSSRKDGQKELKTHYLMLMRNLKQTHNDQLVARLVNSSLKFEELLNMTDKQFAKEDVQIARAQQRIEAAQKSFVKESVANTLEKMVGTTMAGNETWRSKETLVASTPTKEVVDNHMDIDENVLISPSSDINDDMNASSDANDVPADTDEKSPEKPNTAPKKVAKRPLDIDAAARYATSAKIPRLDGDEAASDPNAQNRESVKPKEQSKLLEYLKQSKTSPSPSSKKASDQQAPVTLKLLSSLGTDKFTISKPNGFQFTCNGTVTNKLVQGLLEKSFTIDGRVKVDALNAFITTTVDKGKKIIDCMRMYALEQDENFEAFNSENEKVGLCHISKNSDNKSDGKISFYVIPKAMRNQIPFLDRLGAIEDDNTDDLLFYGIIISAEQGPDLYVNASHRMVEVFASANANKEGPKKPAIVTSNTSPKAAAAPKTKPAVAPAPVAPILKKQIPNELLQKIKKVAAFVASQPNGGSAMITKLKNDQRSKTETPFLFETSPYYNDFVTELKEALSKKQ